MINIFKWFKKKPIVVKPPEQLDIFSEDQCKLDDAVIVITTLCEDYMADDGMKAMTKEVWRQVGNKIFLRGMRRWKI